MNKITRFKPLALAAAVLATLGTAAPAQAADTF